MNLGNIDDIPWIDHDSSQTDYLSHYKFDVTAYVDEGAIAGSHTLYYLLYNDQSGSLALDAT